MEARRKTELRGFLQREVILISVIVPLLIFAGLVRTCLIQAFSIPSPSMTPTLKPADRVLASKLPYCLGGKSRRGDVIVFKAPNNAETLYTKRVIAKEKEEIEIRGGTVYINGAPLREPYARGIPEDYGPLRVPKGTLFVMGDHRDNSEDSRVWGPISEEYTVGKIFFVYHPLKRIGMVK